MSETIQDKEAQPLKIKKPKKLINKVTKDIKVDLTKKPEDKKDVIEDKNPVENVEVVNTEKPKVSEEKLNENESAETPVLESPIKEIERVEEKAITPEPVVETRPEVVMPENINKLVSFMKETGGTIEDYTRLNRDYSQLDENSLLREYYKNTKPHLDHEEISFIMEDNFTYDEDADEERDIKKKKLAFKEEIAKAKNFLKETKEKYYDEIKLRPGVTQDQQKAMDFFNRHNKEQEKVKRIRDNFEANTKELLNENFEGFDFNVGEKTFRYNVSNPSEVVEKQSSLSTFVKKFLNKEGEISDTAGYHKAVYAARNADTIAQHFYEQGKADAVKDVVAKSNNINAEPRNNPTGDVFIGGLKVRAINGVDSSKLKFKTKKKNN
tara:strand:+ start:2927 stop:4069 length:1143 start_codon:yes stop_codon:yes gene_type:complete